MWMVQYKNNAGPGAVIFGCHVIMYEGEYYIASIVTLHRPKIQDISSQIKAAHSKYPARIEARCCNAIGCCIQHLQITISHFLSRVKSQH